ncbi:AraC family transcriptional regulator [Mycolicibacterium conceptionense]|uniref:AraC family transcriptional regulator n=1 Tax=Mycolicibacterium conceptionense TaxID=451644 RepID=A0A1A0P8R4_9MYCO|nr:MULTISPECIES: helix-turn-helix domain-containing protein [Mycolicibacterium]MCW1824820.1 helix-turn-helix domain-containing protein [Mycolicibacterium senegalense]OBB06052.1 AraC family transcriptional regulator [Mycolicibacterium conceptionense]OBF06610.1 AraC family transcriptional regulator [Mycolicibacterium conceptionense]OBF19470.1 AraC family transcriptional regulator [Mycolicibacterium conceptionense]OBF38802.1 AraC family transcriptional regulator [Mycolicibacterium conceptionense]
MAAWKNAPERGVVGRAGNASAFDLHRWAPSEDAARFVEHFWSVSWDRREAGPFESTVITFPAMHLTREWGDDVVRHGHRLPSTLIHGVVPKVFRITISGRGSVVGARFRPGAFTARFGGDAAVMTGRVEQADDELLGTPVVLGEDVTAVRLGMDSAIGAMAGEVDPTYRALTPLVDRMRDDSSLHRVEQVMELSPWSTRTTQRVFQRYVGVTVKWVLCRYRLQQAALEIESAPDIDFADLAVRLGWYDQAHFINDFRSMLGSTPGEYAAEHGVDQSSI